MHAWAFRNQVPIDLQFYATTPRVVIAFPGLMGICSKPRESHFENAYPTSKNMYQTLWSRQLKTHGIESLS